MKKKRIRVFVIKTFACADVSDLFNALGITDDCAENDLARFDVPALARKIGYCCKKDEKGDYIIWWEDQ